MANGFVVQMENILDDYSKEVKRATNNSQDKIAKESVRKLKNTSPKRAGEKHTRKYAEGWRVKRERGANGIVTVTVYNKTNPSLTHLLENGHEIKNGTGRSYGETRGIKHIAPVEQWANSELPREIERELE